MLYADFGEFLFYEVGCIILALRSSRRLDRFLLGPLKGVVSDLLPAILPYRVVRASRELLVVCDGLAVTVVLGVRLVYSWRHEVVLPTRYEQQRRPILVPEVHVNILVSGREIGEGPGPHEAARSGDVVALVDLVRLLPREGVGEGVVELLWGEANRPVAVCGVPQDGEDGPGLRQRYAAHALRGRRVYGHTHCPIAVVEQDLDDQTTHGVSHEDGWLLQLAYDAFVVLDDPRDGQSFDRGGVLVERLDLYLKARVGRGEHTVAAALVVLDPVLPATGCHPQPVNQEDGVRGARVGGVLGSHGGPPNVE